MPVYNVPYDDKAPGNVHDALTQFINENSHINCGDSFQVGTEGKTSRWWLSSIGYVFTDFDNRDRQITCYKRCTGSDSVPDTPISKQKTGYSGGRRRTLHRHRDKNKKQTRRKHKK